jgi:DNA helicase-2/ATP-dependent DNA helicase PcrA
LIKKPVEILQSQPEVAQRFRERFSVIMVDEYQDANVAQFRLLKELCGPETYVCVVGDDDQSIYRFRGAEVKNILEFPDRFSGADIIRLEQNYRSTSPILQAASSVVDHNRGRLGKTLQAEKGNGPLPVLAYLPDQNAEASFCADTIEASVIKKETTWSDWAILYRTNAQSAGFETFFLRRGIPYRVVGSLKFYEREEIKDAIALLSFLVNPRDEVAFRRVVNKPVRGVGSVTVNKIVEASITDSINLMQAGRESKKLVLSAKARKGLNEFFKVIEDASGILNNDDDTEKENTTSKNNIKQKLKSGEGLSICIEKLLIDSGIAEYHEMQDEFSGNSKVNNLQELLNGASLYSNNNEGLLLFLEDIELDRSMKEEAEKQNNQQNSVTLITFHNTKGLEFKSVIMTGLEQGIFPRDDKKGDELEEERRLFYVGVTRAMDELYFTTCAERRMYGKTMQTQPSLFLREIDRSCLKIHNNKNEKIAVASRTSLFKRGDRLFHEDHGYGAVMEIKSSDDGPIVRVRFDSGQEKRFLSEIQGRAYEKIKEDY